MQGKYNPHGFVVGDLAARYSTAGTNFYIVEEFEPLIATQDDVAYSLEDPEEYPVPLKVGDITGCWVKVRSINLRTGKLSSKKTMSLDEFVPGALAVQQEISDLQNLQAKYCK